MNRISGSYISTVRGCLTTGEYWWWWEYTGDDAQFKVSGELMHLSRTNPMSILKIAGVLYWMALDGWCQACKIAQHNLENAQFDMYNSAYRALLEAEQADNEEKANLAQNTIIDSVRLFYNQNEEQLAKWIEP